MSKSPDFKQYFLFFLQIQPNAGTLRIIHSISQRNCGHENIPDKISDADAMIHPKTAEK